MTAIPLILKPRLWATKNRIRDRLKDGPQLLRDSFLGIFALLVMVGIYHALVAAIDKMQSNTHLAYIHPTTLFSLVLLMLFAILLFSNSAAALGSLLLGRDIDLLLAAPISPARFFWGKLIEVSLSASWMALLFGIPSLVAFATEFHTSWLYFPFALFVIIPYFLIPAELGIIGMLVFAAIVPANRTREVLIIAGCFGLLGVFALIRLLEPTNIQFHDTGDLLRLIKLLTMPNANWLPSYWAAACLGEFVAPSRPSMLPYLTTLYAAAISLGIVTYGAMRLLHARAYTLAKNLRHGTKFVSQRAYRAVARAVGIRDPQIRALFLKEIRTFLRDMSQALQMMLLLGLCVIYLYNFRVLSALDELPAATRAWWQSFLTIGNFGMGAFVMTAVGTRFVFPSVSLEGPAYWILQKAPLSTTTLLRAKFACWYVPLAAIASVILAAGAVAINSEPHIIAVTALCAWLTSYGTVGMAVGLGAVFANFKWEHSSQLAASFGSLLYMVCGVILVALNIIPVALLISFRTFRNLDYHFSAAEWYISVSACAFLLLYINYAATRWTMKMGQQALEDRE